MEEFTGLAGWYWLAVKSEVRDIWAALPRPWWGKAIMLLVLVACQLIPSQLDDIAVIAVMKAVHARKQRKAAAQ